MGGSLPVLTLAAVATPLLASACNTLTLRRDPALQLPAGSPRHADIAARIRHEGFLFFVMQLAAALAFSADLPLISALRDPAQAGVYAIVQRMFSVIPLSLTLVWAPLWPTYRHALAAGHHQWVARTVRRSIVMAVLLAGVLGSLIVVGFDWISSLWLHRALAVGLPLLLGFATWSVLEAAGTALATFLNAASVMRIQVIAACVFATVCVSGKYWAIRHGGIAWLPWVTVITYSLTALLPFAWNWKRIFAEAVAKRF
jgi:O-antigen/teichoic acid export membrane protein